MEKMGSWRALWESLYKLWDNREVKRAVEALKQLVRLSLEESNRADVSGTDLSALSGFVCSLLKRVRLSDLLAGDDQWDACFEGVKLIRNLVAGISCNQLVILNDSSLLSAIIDLCNNFSTFSTPDSSTIQLLRVTLQLLGNLCVCCDQGQQQLWTLCHPSLFQHLLRSGYDPVVDISCMIIHTCVRESSSRRMESIELLIVFLCCLAEEAKEWLDILLELLIVKVPLELLWQRCCDHPKEGLALLKFVLGSLSVATNHSFEMDTHPAAIGDANTELEPTPQSEPSGKDGQSCRSKSRSVVSVGYEVYVAVTTKENLECLSCLFCDHAKSLMSQDAAANVRLSSWQPEEHDSIEFQLMRCCLSVLNSVCGSASALQYLQNQSKPISTALDLLNQLSLWDGSANSARHRTRLVDTTPANNDKLHPFFGLKRDLVRLIANLSYKNLKIQELVSNRGQFPLILNQCSIDHRNPYITQWAVLAIRNLCENNPTNQMLVARLESQGAPNTTAKLLHELGCEVEVDKDGKMKVKGHHKQCE